MRPPFHTRPSFRLGTQMRPQSVRHSLPAQLQDRRQLPAPAGPDGRDVDCQHRRCRYRWHRRTDPAGFIARDDLSVPASVFPGGSRTQAVTVRLDVPGSQYLERWNQVDVNLRKLIRVGRLQVACSCRIRASGHLWERRRGSSREVSCGSRLKPPSEWKGRRHQAGLVSDRSLGSPEGPLSQEDGPSCC